MYNLSIIIATHKSYNYFPCVKGRSINNIRKYLPIFRATLITVCCLCSYICTVVLEAGNRVCSISIFLQVNTRLITDLLELWRSFRGFTQTNRCFVWQALSSHRYSCSLHICTQALWSYLLLSRFWAQSDQVMRTVDPLGLPKPSTSLTICTNPYICTFPAVR